jgi:hypothetical protein
VLRVQAQQALIAAQQAAANAPPKQVDGWVPTRLISDLFVSGRDPATPTGATRVQYTCLVHLSQPML